VSLLARVARRLAAGVIALTVAASCSSDVSATWTEQVATTDGSVVTIQREQFLEDQTAIGNSRTLLLQSSTIRALEPPGLFPPLTVPVVPLRLEVNLSTREVVLIGYADHCEARYAAGNPPAGLVEYSLEGSAWQARPASDRWIGMPSNLLVGTPGRGHLKRAIDLAEKARVHSEPSIPANYLRITPSLTADVGCRRAGPSTR
jgi:hypothetical protein